MSRLRYTSTLLVSLCAISNPTHAIVGGHEPARNDTRFDAIAAFSKTIWIDGSDNNNCGDCNATFGNATLIAPDMVLFARHLLPNWQPPDSGFHTVRFRRNPDGSLGSLEQGWESFHQVKIVEYILFDLPVAPYDAVIGILEEPVLHIAPIAIDTNLAVGAGDAIILAGWGKEGPLFDEGPRGRLLLADTESIGIEHCRIQWLPPSHPDNPCACGPNMFDSGGAVLVELTDSSLRLVGVIVTVASGVDVRGLFDPEFEACCAQSPEGCADFNEDGIVDLADFLIVLANWGDCGDCKNCPGDANGDCVVGTADMLILLSQWGGPCPPPPCDGDLDGDGTVGVADYLILLANWGPCDVGCECLGDIDEDRSVGTSDYLILLANWGPCP